MQYSSFYTNWYGFAVMLMLMKIMRIKRITKFTFLESAFRFFDFHDMLLGYLSFLRFDFLGEGACPTTKHVHQFVSGGVS